MTPRLLSLVLLGGATAVPLLVAAGLHAVRYEASRPEPPPVRESQDVLLEAAVRGCVAGGGTSWTGIDESGLVVHRCRPWLDLGTEPVAWRVGR